MKIIHISTLALTWLNINASAQNPLTNTVAKFHLPGRAIEDMLTVANALNRAYNVRVRSEESMRKFFIEKQIIRQEKLPDISAKYEEIEQKFKPIFKLLDDEVNKLPNYVKLNRSYVDDLYRE